MPEVIAANLVGECREVKVGDFEVAGVVEDEVLRLDVSVIDAARVAISYGGDQLLKVTMGEVLGEAAAGNARVELAAAGELEDEVDLGAGGEDLGSCHSEFLCAEDVSSVK